MRSCQAASGSAPAHQQGRALGPAMGPTAGSRGAATACCTDTANMAHQRLAHADDAALRMADGARWARTRTRSLRTGISFRLLPQHVLAGVGGRDRKGKGQPKQGKCLRTLGRNSQYRRPSRHPGGLSHWSEMRWDGGGSVAGQEAQEGGCFGASSTNFALRASSRVRMHAV